MALKDALPGSLVILLLLAVTAAAWRKRPAVAYLGTWFFATLAPASSFIPVATEVGAERRMYLPLIAIVVAVVIGGRLLLSRLLPETEPRWRNRMAALCLVVVSCVLIGLTLERTNEYQSGTGIWQTVLDRRPDGRAHYNLAIELKEQGNRFEAMRHYELALADEPDAHYAIGFELDADGKHEEAIQHFREYIRLRPDDINVIRAYVLLGRALKIEERLEPAAEAFRQALQRQPSNVDALAGLAEALLKQERYDDAIHDVQGVRSSRTQRRNCPFRFGNCAGGEGTGRRSSAGVCPGSRTRTERCRTPIQPWQRVGEYRSSRGGGELL